MIDRVTQLKDELREHRLYRMVTTPVALRIFMERHVVCVWDFMNLLKSIQNDIASTRIPWIPPADSEAARFVNEIVLAEESDRGPGGRPTSHFEWYREAMLEVRADTNPIDRLLASLSVGAPFEAAIENSSLPHEAIRFTQATWSFLSEPLPVRAAVFYHSREDLIPRMFPSIVKRLADKHLPCDTLVQYLERHVAIDSDKHGPLANRLLERLCESDPSMKTRTMVAACRAVAARRELWDATVDRILQLTPRSFDDLTDTKKMRT
ncbi:hypothetical protein Pan216_43300 [Planctomycetes bacterium Pan216]|uniref:DUF3050 domain-containing protein n=1 Tax=Kolteria novifilia TaxID=2527975 RepID=A0A518B8Z4_9BACT|nr:hypothetical protein Pan216_43300 [Planctomycetes bacterium Pan216]